jgi:hypothetical protein
MIAASTSWGAALLNSESVAHLYVSAGIAALNGMGASAIWWIRNRSRAHSEFRGESYLDYIRRTRRRFEEMGYSANEGWIRPIPAIVEPWSDYRRRRLEEDA